MPRPRLPPTPLSSTDIVGKDRLEDSDMDCSMVLPPPAVSSKDTRPHLLNNNTQSSSSTRPLSPVPPMSDTGTPLQRKRTHSESTKSKMKSSPRVTHESTVDTTLPPPPSRARKIIHMKPKHIPAGTVDDARSPSKSTLSGDGSAQTQASTSSTKKKQNPPSTTSAAGRKIARKTAHSIIERRRRCKMNEEFGVLRDMIPACAGTEMHKLAILQAGIEYVKYLEDCIGTLKAQNENLQSRRSIQHKTIAVSEAEDEAMDIEEEEHSDSHNHDSPSAVASESETMVTSTNEMSHASGELQQSRRVRKSSFATTSTCSALTSPELPPISSMTSTHVPAAVTNTNSHRVNAYDASNQYHNMYSTSPTSATAQTPVQTGVSPAFGAFQFSPDLSRISNWSSTTEPNLYNKPSPQILPLPQAALPFPTSMASASHKIAVSNSVAQRDGHAEATATAALLMMTKDRRGSLGTSKPRSGKGMSVKELLSS